MHAAPHTMLLLLAAGLAAADAQTHGGFLVQLNLGIGYTAIDSGSRVVGSNGPALNAGVHLGYSFDGPIAIALHGFVDGEIITTDAGASDRPEPGNAGYLFGAGPELLLTAYDLRFGLTPALVGIIHGSSGVATDLTLGAVISVTREWGISQRWSAGIRGEFIYAHVPHPAAGFDASPVDVYSATVGVSFTYH